MSLIRPAVRVPAEGSETRIQDPFQIGMVKVQTFIFLALGSFPPFSTRSAPTFFPLEGQPYLGAQEDARRRMAGISSARATDLLSVMWSRFDGFLCAWSEG